MRNEVMNQLSPLLLTHLQKPTLIMLSTIDSGVKKINVASLSWVYGKSEQIIYLAIDSRSKIIEDTKINPEATITLIANNTVYAISGTLQTLTNKLPNIPFDVALLEFTISEVRDAMFYGAKIAQEPAYTRTYSEKAAAKLDEQVFTEMNNYQR